MKSFWKGLAKSEKEEYAKKVGTSAEYLRQVFMYGKPVGHEMAQKIEVHIGIPRHELRPDIYPPEEYKRAG